MPRELTVRRSPFMAMLACDGQMASPKQAVGIRNRPAGDQRDGAPG
jgi:hypothetical protein